MTDDKKLTTEQQQLIASLTEEDKKQIAALLTPDGKIDEEKLESVSGGISEKAKTIIKWATSGIITAAALGTLVGAGIGAGAYFIKHRNSTVNATPAEIEMESPGDWLSTN